MKKYFYLASICFALSFTSCEDFLSVESPDELTTDNYWRNEDDAQAGLAAAYSQLYHGDTYATSEVRWPTEEFRADLFKLGSDAGNYDQWVALYYLITQMEIHSSRIIIRTCIGVLTLPIRYWQMCPIFQILMMLHVIVSLMKRIS